MQADAGDLACHALLHGLHLRWTSAALHGFIQNLGRLGYQIAVIAPLHVCRSANACLLSKYSSAIKQRTFQAVSWHFTVPKKLLLAFPTLECIKPPTPYFANPM